MLRHLPLRRDLNHANSCHWQPLPAVGIARPADQGLSLRPKRSSALAKSPWHSLPLVAASALPVFIRDRGTESSASMMAESHQRHKHEQPQGVP